MAFSLFKRGRRKPYRRLVKLKQIIIDMVARLFFLSICLPFLLTSCQQSKKTVEFVDYVNPLMGTESTFAFSHGNTYPAVAVPWGMNFWTPARPGRMAWSGCIRIPIV